MELSPNSIIKRYNIFNQGKYTITSSYSAVSYYNVYFTITFNHLMNPTTKYSPAIGFVDLSYFMTYNLPTFIVVISYFKTSTDFTILVEVYNSPTKLARFSIDYLAVSKDLTDFFIYIDITSKAVNRIISTTNSYTSTKSLSQPLPITSNITTFISINYLYPRIINASSNLYDYQITISLLNTTDYSWTLSSPSTNSYVYWLCFYVIFY